MISTTPPFVLKLSKDERKDFQQNHINDAFAKSDSNPQLECARFRLRDRLVQFFRSHRYAVDLHS